MIQVAPLFPKKEKKSRLLLLFFFTDMLLNNPHLVGEGEEDKPKKTNKKKTC